MKRPNSFFIILLAVLVIGASFSSGVFFGYNSRPEVEWISGVLNKDTPDGRKEVDFGAFWKAWQVLEDKHIGEEEIDREKLVWGAIQGMVNSIDDPYTVFFPPRDLEDFNTEIKGEFSGIGAEIGIRQEILTVISPLKDSPAEQAGLAAGDKILKIADEFTNNMTLDDAVHNIRGERGTKIILTVARANVDEPFEVEITRDRIKLPIIDTEEKEGGIFLIQLYSFSERSHIEFGQAVQEYFNSDSTKLIVDLRNNPGGFFSSAVDIASWFVPEGEIIAREEFREGEPTLYKSSGRGALENVPTVILINQGSASASEILAGALQEHGKATLIGQQTFGKGSVQQLQTITTEPETSLKVTIARWLTPNGLSISKQGLTPDIEVKFTEDTPKGTDPQLERAIEYLRDK
ncbi:MAG: S41 family peptidase [bacterium]|nr:S41 family peptidase [bacterium]